MFGRAIQDSIMVAFETIHIMKNKRCGKQGDVAFKIDVRKVYDRVDWNYLVNILFRLRFLLNGLSGLCYVLDR